METQLMKGILEGCVLAVLQKEPSYGYRVVEWMRTLGFADVAEATIYPILSRLERNGRLISEKRPSSLGPPRKYYRLTTTGEQALGQFTESWNAVSRIVDDLLKEEWK